MDWPLTARVICLWCLQASITFMNTRRAERKPPLPPGCLILRDWPSRAKPCLCLNPRLWGCWPLALLHFSCAATVGIRKKFHLTGGLEAKAEVTVPSLDDWEKEGERAENVESGKLKCATKVAAGGFSAKAHGHLASELRRRIDANPFLAHNRFNYGVEKINILHGSSCCRH